MGYSTITARRAFRTPLEAIRATQASVVLERYDGEAHPDDFALFDPDERGVCGRVYYTIGGRVCVTYIRRHDTEDED